MANRNLSIFAMYMLAAASIAHAQCAADPKWLPNTPAPADGNPNSPKVDCPFYQAAWQHFLLATQPGADGTPAFIGYRNIEDLFGPSTLSRFLFPRRNPGLLSLAPAVAQRPNDNALTPAQAAVAGSDVFQAGLRGLLIDQNGRPVFYGIHVDRNFSDFLASNHLRTKADLLAAPETLSFPKGVVELKSAWQIVDGANPPKTYITANAVVPLLKIQDHRIVVDRTRTRTVKVALLALHVVFGLEGHPELIWSTFEHADPATHELDLAPKAAALPTGSPGHDAVATTNFTLYKAGTPADQANSATVTDQAADPPFDEKTQTFRSAGGVVQTSIYRLFPGSKSNDPKPDDEVGELNESMTSLFAKLGAGDTRAHYRLAGAVWLRRPLGDQGSFKLDARFANADGQGTDDLNSMLQGEDRLSGMAMESFTQDQFPNCFSCHNTRKITDDDTDALIIKAKLLNVSHVISKFLSSQEAAPPPPAATKNSKKK